MKHIIKQGTDSAKSVLLQYGTSGTEQDLLPLTDIVDKEVYLMSPVSKTLILNGSNVNIYI